MTPRLTGSILDGVTRDSVLKLAQDKLGLTIKESDLLLKDLFKADEVFCTGTAVVITPVGCITYNKKPYKINDGNMGKVSSQIRKLLIGIQLEEEEDTLDWIHLI